MDSIHVFNYLCSVLLDCATLVSTFSAILLFCMLEVIWFLIFEILFLLLQLP